ncbi:glycoside hydrolase [filamentous cyanobacterium CCP5]|nr:glycoside hydrolase [filamentous cyanobacterium CCP5]
MTALILLGVAWVISQWSTPGYGPRLMNAANWVETPQPLVMRGGDPYIRALMRTISASESNMDTPYHLLYGGKTVDSLAHHPEICVPITAGPNRGNCTTAAGRYQFINTTWQEKAKRYHPKPPSWYAKWQDYPFDPTSQDAVVYRWLTDKSAWNADIPAMLRQGQLEEVLKLLSGTWTSLGYGLETNRMTPHLPRIYAEMLQEEINNGS